MKKLNNIIKELNKPIEIVFLEPDSLHPASNTQTIANVAQNLEDKYHLIENFTKSYKEKILNKLIEYVSRGRLDWQFLLSEWIKSEWREYMINELHGIKTKLSSQQQREAFIDTGAYYKSLQVFIRIK